ncbi:CGNR zinc finger domain-containing protein [Streptomyces sp. Da 82-17]|uniref:CGNR zinc finger domain-containing protein n=1 Tax=Streptomyces sp. Da 82-17 TaxID=3377116 RepID=UPI0038D393E5
MIDAPASARLVEAFANTVDVELGTDELDTASKLSAWLTAQELLDRGRRVTAEDHALCLRLRAGIREELGANVGDAADPAHLTAADEALRALPVFVTVGSGGSGGSGGSVGSAGRTGALTPDPALTPVRRALASIAVAWSELVVTGEAARLKRCAEHACAWVFWDVSKNRSRRWCSMRVCGNRNKARRYAARQTATTTTRP